MFILPPFHEYEKLHTNKILVVIGIQNRTMIQLRLSHLQDLLDSTLSSVSLTRSPWLCQLFARDTTAHFNGRSRGSVLLYGLLESGFDCTTQSVVVTLIAF